MRNGYFVFFLAASATLAAMPASAHGILGDSGNPWTTWNPTLEIVLGTIIALALYATGAWRRRHKADRVRVLRHGLFVVGMAAIFLSLQSPIDPVAERSFFAHQIQHLLLRMIGPMLVMLSFPQGCLVAGAPDWLQRRVAAPLVANGLVQRCFAFIARPTIVIFLFIGNFYFWQIPAIHSAALLNDTVHYAMHASLMFTGFLFFWRIFDPRPAPLGAGYGVRLMMLWLVALSNMALGSYFTLKESILYPVYDTFGRLGGYPAIVDEQLGGIFVWIPSGMMVLASLLIVIHMWGRQETKDDRRRLAKLERHGHGWNAPPMTGAEMIAQSAPKNRSMAYGLTGFVLCVFTTAIMFGVVNLILAA